MARGGIDGDEELLLGRGDGADILEKYGSIIKDRMETLRQQILKAADEDMHQIEQDRRTLLTQVQRMMEEFDYKLREVSVGFNSRRDGALREENLPGCLAGVVRRMSSLDIEDPVAYLEDHLSDVMDLLDDIQFQRDSAPSRLTLGHIVQPKILRLIASIKLPQPAGPSKRCITALPDGKVAIGHESGGVDFFQPDQGIKRVINGVTVRDMTALPDGRLMILSYDRHIHVFDSHGEALQELSPQETCFMFSLAVDTAETLFVGDCEMEKIFVFDLKSEAKVALRTIPTTATTPWQLYVLSSGSLLMADPCPPCGPAIKLVDQSGSNLCTLCQEEWSSAWCTVDMQDQIYVVSAKKGAEKHIAIDVYTPDGKLLENLAKNLKIPKFQWLSVAVPSPGSIAICTETYLFVYTWRSQFQLLGDT